MDVDGAHARAAARADAGAAAHVQGVDGVLVVAVRDDGRRDVAEVGAAALGRDVAVADLDGPDIADVELVDLEVEAVAARAAGPDAGARAKAVGVHRRVADDDGVDGAVEARPDAGGAVVKRTVVEVGAVGGVAGILLVP